MRSWRSELLSTATVLTIPVVIVLAFPFAALDFRAQAQAAARHPRVALVKLTAEAEAAAIRAAKTDWRGGEDDYRRSDLKLGELPSPESAPVLELESRTRPVPSLPPLPPLPRYRPSAAAPAPVPLPQDGVIGDEVEFSKAELLEIH